MEFKTLILCCILQSIAGAKVLNHKIEPRIAGGRNAAEGQAPFQCSLQDKSPEHFCGCAIISDEYIVTAAHCLEGKTPDEIQIVVGTNRWKSGGTRYEPENFLIHESYDKPQSAYDIGLIRVRTPIKFSEKVQPIKYSPNQVPVGADMQVTGWGKPQINGTIPDNLQVLNVKSISNEQCKKDDKFVHDSHLCTLGPRGKGICGTDSGGPLVFNNELVGLVNWRKTIVCATGKPEGYARISYLYDWIQKNTNSQ